MRSKLLLALMVLLPWSVMAQTYQSGFQDGKIWFRISQEVRITSALNEDPLKLPFRTIPGFEGMVSKYNVTHLSRPFYAAKTSNELQRTYLVEFSSFSEVDHFVKELERLKGVEYAEKVPLDKTCLTPNDPSYGSQWGLSMISAPLAWNYFSSGSNTVIAIVDDAVERTHPDLSPNVWVNSAEIPSNGIDDDGNGYIDDINGYDVGSNDNNPNPPSSAFDHGTHVAGIASARTNNATGVASIGFSCKLMCVKSTTTPTAITNGYDGIVYAAASGADVINMSWGGPTYTTTGQTIVNYAYSQGCVLIAAAGNDNVSSQFYPAAYTNVVSVAATTNSDTKASFSNYGSWIDVSAPGNNIFSTTVGATYGNKSGTSMASPMVAGLAGLMKSLNPGITQADLINCLLTTADNINAMNPGYIGQLGSGRIDANAAMTCVASTLNNPPTADFVANYTTITAGGSVIFTDLSTYTPTTWNWTFTGGTPASYVGQNPPPIVYNTPGTYNVSLTATNANGTDTETKTSYITVTAASGCQRINLPLPAGWTPVNYGLGTPVGNDGWVNGANMYLDKEKAMYFDASASPYTTMNNVWVAFGRAYSTNPAKIVPVRVYDGTSGSPGAQIGTGNLTMGQIMSDVAGGFYTELSFVNNPITLPASKRFFVSVDVSNLCWSAGCHDTLNVVSNTNGQTVPSAIWEKQSDNSWHQYNTAGSWSLNASLLVHPFLTNANSVAAITPSATTICSGNNINFSAAGSTYEDTLLWVFNGGNPNVVSENPSVSVMYNTPGTYNAILYTVGGGCHLFDSSFVSITVNPSPVVSLTGDDEICSGGSTPLTASGASAYSWAPPTGLSATSGPNVTASPTTTTTYEVTGTLGSCSSSAIIVIQVDNPPVATATLMDSVVGCTTTITFDGNGSTDADNFAWNFPGGSPASSGSSTPTISYGTAGANSSQLIVTNDCGADTVTLNFNVIIDNNLSAAFTASDTTIDCGDAIDYNGGISTDADNFAWTFNGGTPGTSTSATNTITYNTPGNYTTQLIASNGCGSDTVSYSLTVLNNCNVGIEDVENNLTGYYSPSAQAYVIQSLQGFQENISVQLLNEIGQVIYAGVADKNTAQILVPVQQMRAGMYIVALRGTTLSKSFKFIIH